MRKFDKRVPEIVKASDEEGRIRIEQLKRSGAVVYDGFDAIVRGSFEIPALWDRAPHQAPPL